MTRKEALRQVHQEAALARNGFTAEEAAALRRLSIRAHTWNERLCNDTEVDDDGKAYRRSAYTGKRWACQNIGKGIETRIAAIQAAHPDVIIYEQGDPRGCALYVIPRAALGDRPAESYYSSVGIPVY